ncbi:MAG: hypothetical protein GY832_24235 [Chloroflexi bacterium]|nr:hypothetical protein [Chloroflexota bacterium]
MADLYRGAHCFLVLGGPSLKKMPLELLGRRGVLIMSINNCPAALPVGVRPHIWTHTDPPGKFLDSIWKDPAILKFAPCRTWSKSNPDTKKRDGVFERDPATGEIVSCPGVRCRDMPGIIGYNRNTGFYPENWLFEPSINRGNDRKNATGQDKHGKQVQTPNGWPRVINTMFTAVRLAFYLGIENLYLIGADFNMGDSEKPYAFKQDKSAGGVSANNWAFTKMCAMFDDLRPRMESAGFFVHNCTPDSDLWSFDNMPFEEAIERATRGLEQGEMNTHGWYTKD